MRGRMEGREEVTVQNEQIELDPRETKIKEFENDGIRYHTEDIEDKLRTSYSNLDGSSIKWYIDKYLDELEHGTDMQHLEESVDNYDYKNKEYSETELSDIYENDAESVKNPNYSEKELKDIWDNEPGEEDKHMQERDQHPLIDEEIHNLYKNDAESVKQPSYTEEELHEVWENDPGYINEHVMKELPSYDSKTGELLSDKDKIVSEQYLKEGLHKDVINWGPESIEGTKQKVELDSGTVLVRWGGESGHFAAPKGTVFEDLQLPVSKDKLEKSEYIILKPFGGPDSDMVEKSEVAAQPWNKQASAESTDTSEHATQYKFEKSIEELVKEGYLAKIDD